MPYKHLMCLFINGIDHILANSIYCCITQSASRHNANSGPLSRWLWVAPRGLAGTASLTGITHSTRKQKSNSINKVSRFLSSRIFGVSVNQPSIRLSFNLFNDQVNLVRCSRTNDRDCRAGNRVCGFRCLPKPKARRSGYTPLVTASLMFEVLPQLTETPVGIKPIELVSLGS